MYSLLSSFTDILFTLGYSICRKKPVGVGSLFQPYGVLRLELRLSA